MLLLLCFLALSFIGLNAGQHTRDSSALERLTASSLAQAAQLVLQDTMLKSSEFILHEKPKQVGRYVFLDTILKQGKHHLWFNVGKLQSDRETVPAKHGKLKHSRPIWVLFVVIFLFLIVGVLRVAFPGEIRTIVDAYYKERLLLQVSKEDNLATSWPYIFLYVLFSLSLGLFVVIILSSFGESRYLRFENFLKNSFFVAALFIAKILIIRFISFIFLLDKIVREYVAVLYLVYFNSMFCLMPFLLAAAFVPSSYIRILLNIYIVLVVLLFTYRFFRTAVHLFSNFKFSIFYLILYLCTLELAPILILVRALNN